MMKRILVLGSRGYLGRHLVEYLWKNPDNKVYGIDKNLVDLRDLDHCLRLFRHLECDEIYQMAADSGNMKYLLSKDYSYGDSTVINLTIIKALRTLNYKGRLLFPSSLYVYDRKSRYGIEKLYNEQLYSASGLDVSIARLFSVYGPGEKLNSPGEKVTTAFCRKFIESNGAITVEGNPSQVRYFLYVTDAIEGLISQMEFNIPATLDFAGDEEITFGRMLRTLGKIHGKGHKVRYTLENKDEGVIIPSTKATKAILSWQPKVTFEDGMEKLYNWTEKELYSELH